MAHGLAGRGKGVGRPIEFSHHGVERARHIGSGVTIGNGVHIETVDAGGMGLHRVAEGDNGLAEVVGGQPIECGHVAKSNDFALGVPI
jgi:hypothetical protein